MEMGGDEVGFATQTPKTHATIDTHAYVKLVITFITYCRRQVIEQNHLNANRRAITQDN